MAQTFSNFGFSILSAALSNSATSLTVVDGSSFPSSGNFTIRIDNELMTCTARSGNTLTVVRGVEGTTATNHSSTSDVEHVLSRGGLLQVIDDNSSNFSGAYSDLTGKPTLGTAAALDVGTDALDVVQLNGSGELPAVSGVNLTDIDYETLDNLPTLGTAADNAETDFLSTAPANSARNTITPAGSTVGITINSPGGSTDLFQIKNEGASVVAGYTAAGKSFAANLLLSGTSNSDIPLVVRSGSGSTNVAEFTNTGGGVNYLTIDYLGNLTGAWFTTLATSLSTMQTDINSRMIGSNNLSEISSQTTARTNLGLGTMALNDNASYYTTTQVDGFFSTTNGNVTTAQAAATAAQGTADTAASSASSAASAAATAASDAATALAAASAAQSTANAAATPGAVTAEISAAVASVTALIPTNNSSLSNGAGYITSVAGGSLASMSNDAGFVTGTIPTTTSQLTNDSGFVAGTGFSGSGSYTSFTISNGLITSAS